MFMRRVAIACSMSSGEHLQRGEQAYQQGYKSPVCYYVTHGVPLKQTLLRVKPRIQL